MKQILISILFLITLGCTPGQKQYKISVKITGDHPALNKGEAWLNTLSRFETFADTVNVHNGKFTFRGEINTPGNATIRIKGLDNFIIFYLENDSYEITSQADDLKNAVIKGGETRQMLFYLDSLKRSGASQIYMDSVKRFLAMEKPLSAFALDLLTEEAKTMTETPPVQEKLDRFRADPSFRNNVNLKIIEDLIHQKKFLDPGNPAHVFQMEDPEGNRVSVDSVFVKNKMTLLYFWAGCNDRSRKLNPLIKDLYTEYHPKGLEIIGVSLDDIRGEWINAIREDSLPWIQITDLQGTFTPIIPYYEINTLPLNVLIDQQGKIVKRKIPFDELDRVLGSLLP
jgi:thiol-disulfide isomerase/thioredoxin